MKRSQVIISTTLFLSLASAAAFSQTTVYSNSSAGDAVTGANYTPLTSSPGWFYGYDDRGTETSGIDSTFAHNGNGSFHMQGTDASAKADITYYNPAGIDTLGNLTGLSYDWYVDSSSTTGYAPAPALKLFLEGNSYSATAHTTLTFEPYLQSSTPPVHGAWQSSDLFNIDGAGHQANLWMYQTAANGGLGNDNAHLFTLSQLISGAVTSGYASLSANTKILGFSISMGSGWAGYFDGAADNLQFSTVNTGSHQYNFEVAPAPEPVTVAIFALGLAGIVVLRRK